MSLSVCILCLCTIKLGTLCGKLQQHVAATDHIKQLVAATHCNDTSQQQITLCVLENFCEKSLTLQQNSVSPTR